MFIKLRKIAQNNGKWRDTSSSVRSNESQEELGIRSSIECYSRAIRKGADEDGDESSNMSGTITISLRADEHFYSFLPALASRNFLYLGAP